jgi:hypothetical protein
MDLNVHNVLRKVVVYYTRKHKNVFLKKIEIIINFKDKTLTYKESRHFQKFIFIQK